MLLLRGRAGRLGPRRSLRTLGTVDTLHGAGKLGHASLDASYAGLDSCGSS